MSRKRERGGEEEHEPVGGDELSELFALPDGELPELVAAGGEPATSEASEASTEHQVETEAAAKFEAKEANVEAETVVPTAEDLESQGFSHDEVRRLVLVSDRQASSDESQVAEATLRRLRFTRWLIEHGVLDEWSA